ncbi:MAG: hemerythrin domain-containing protein [Betaproteobacteria bacterium]|nr:hemerythrin domain-containing protein [Betaproteobacteria bacterium]
MTAIDPIAAWHTEHVYFNQLLSLLRKQLDVFHQGDRPNYELMQDIVGYLRDYSDQYHHPREDVAFERLARRCPDMELVLARLHQEHRVIAHTGEVLLRMIEAILEDAIVPREQLESALATYLVYYGNHLAKEEEDVLPLAAKELGPLDWQAVKDAAPSGRDPVFGERSSERYRELRRQIALES